MIEELNKLDARLDLLYGEMHKLPSGSPEQQLKLQEIERGEAEALALMRKIVEAERTPSGPELVKRLRELLSR